MPGFPGLVTAAADLARADRVPAVPDEVQRLPASPRGGQGRSRRRPDLDGRSAIPWGVADVLAGACLDKTGAGGKAAVGLVRGD